MDWETYFGITGLILMVLGVFIFNFNAHKKIEKLYIQILDVARTNKKILQTIQVTLVEDVQGKGEILAKLEELDRKNILNRNKVEKVNSEPKFWSKLYEYSRNSNWFFK